MYEESLYSTRNEKKKQGKLVGFNVALCVVLLKEKVPVTQVTSKGKTSSVSIESKMRNAPGIFYFQHGSYAYCYIRLWKRR